jgi:DNA repair protein RecN (Recombination protein N)
MLRRLALRDVVIVTALELEFDAGFTVLTGETGAGKSILIDALQLALGNRADATLVREGATRAEVSAEFDTPARCEAGWTTPASPPPRLAAAAPQRGQPGQEPGLDQRQRRPPWRSCARWPMQLVDIHGQHAWQGLTRPAAVRALLDAQAGLDGTALAGAWGRHWRQAQERLDDARRRRDTLERERERLAWQVAELDKLAPGADEWDELEAEHQRLAHGQALLDGARAALDQPWRAEPPAQSLLARAVDALDEVARYDAALAAVVEVLRAAQAQLQDAAHSLQAYLGRVEPDPGRLAELDARLSAWLSLARRYRRSRPNCPRCWPAGRRELAALDAAADLEALEREVRARPQAAWRAEARRVSAARAAAPRCPAP